MTITHYAQTAIDIPDLAATHENLGNALLLLGNRQEAISHYEQALRIKPNYPEALNEFAWLLATRESAEGGDPIRAVALAQQACQLTHYREAWYLDTLAAAYAAASRFTDAIATAETALELARAGGQSRMAGQIESRLKLYRDGRAYREAADATKLPPAN
jgi:tetratricopeptide (TPR) repeat protein